MCAVPIYVFVLYSVYVCILYIRYMYIKRKSERTKYFHKRQRPRPKLTLYKKENGHIFTVLERHLLKKVIEYNRLYVFHFIV